MDVICIGIVVVEGMGRPIDRVPQSGSLEIFDQFKLHPGGCAVNPSDGQRRFLHLIGANQDLRYQDSDFEFVRKAKILHLAGFSLMPGFDGREASLVLQKAKEIGLITSLGTAWNPRVKD